MPVNVTKLKKKEAEHKFQYEGEEVIIKFKPATYTFAYIDEHAGESITKSILDLLIEWNLTEEDEKGKLVPVPLTNDGVASLPLELMEKIWDEMMDNLRPNQKKQTPEGSFG